jgi:hypothetical protein
MPISNSQQSWQPGIGMASHKIERALRELRRAGQIAAQEEGRRARYLERGVNFELNPARRKSGEPGFGFAGLDEAADLELPLPDVGFDGGRDIVFDAFVNQVILPI